MAFSEAELIFLALIFLPLIFMFALGFLMPLLGKRNNTSTVKKPKKKTKGRKRATRQRHCQDHPYRSRRGPDENDDHEPYDPRDIIFR